MNRTTEQCRHCRREIIPTSNGWADPMAAEDDEVWRFTCDSHDTFPADHQPTEQKERIN